MDSKLEARLEKIENRLDALWRSSMEKTPESLKELKDGVWYKGKGKNSTSIAFRVSESKGYGFDLSGNWTDYCPVYTPEIWEYASEEEVKEALIKEAERRYGKIKLGMNFKGHWNEKTVLMIDKEDWYYYDRHGFVFGKNATALMVDGKWAEIVHDEIKKGDKYYHNIYHNLKAVAIENTEKERFEAVVISEDKNCASEGFKIGKITECWLNEWTKVDNL